MKKRITALFMTALILLSLTACGFPSGKSDCKKLISNVEKACNDMDMSALLDCMNPEKVSVVKMVVNTIKDSANKAMEYVLDFFGLTITDNGSEEVSVDEAMKTIELKPEKFDLQDSSGTVTCKTSFKAGEKIIEKTIVFDVIKIDDTWYIDGMSSAKE